MDLEFKYIEYANRPTSVYYDTRISHLFYLIDHSANLSTKDREQVAYFVKKYSNYPQYKTKENELVPPTTVAIYAIGSKKCFNKSGCGFLPICNPYGNCDEDRISGNGNIYISLYPWVVPVYRRKHIETYMHAYISKFVGMTVRALSATYTGKQLDDRLRDYNAKARAEGKTQWQKREDYWAIASKYLDVNINEQKELL